MIAKIPMILEFKLEGGYTVDAPLLRKLVTVGDSMAEVLANV